MFIARTQSGLYVRGIKWGKLVLTSRALAAREFASEGEFAEWFTALAPNLDASALELVN